MRSPLSRVFGARRVHPRPFGRPSAALLFAGTCGTVIVATSVMAPWASASPSGVGLGGAAPFAVLGATAVTNTGASVISGDLGVSPGTSVTGTPQVQNGTIYKATAVAATAQASLVTAYNDAAGRTPTTSGDFSTTGLGGKSLVPGVYRATSTMNLTGALTLDGGGDPNAVFVFQAGSSLVTASSSTVTLIGGAQACNVFWKVGSSATLGTTSSFVGTVMALTSVTLTSHVKVTGRVLARTGDVTLIDDTVTVPSTCVTATAVAPTISTVAPASGPTSGGTTVTITGTGFLGVSGATGVKFGTTPATSYTVTSTTTMTATSPIGTGTVTITVTAAGSKATKAGAFTYLAAAATTTTTTPGAGTTGTTAPGTTGTTAPSGGTVVPLGSPQTGLGGSSRSGPDPLLLAVGAVALCGAAVALWMALRQRRVGR